MWGEAGLDFLVTGGFKWLLGEPGIAYLYVRREVAARFAADWSGLVCGYRAGIGYAVDKSWVSVRWVPGGLLGSFSYPTVPRVR